MATFNTLIIPAEDQSAANQFWFDRGAGENNFSVGLVPTSGPSNVTPATHYVSSGQFERYFPGSIFAFTSDFPNAVALEYVGNSTGNLTYVNQQLAAQNLQRQTSGI